MRRGVGVLTVPPALAFRALVLQALPWAMLPRSLDGHSLALGSAAAFGYRYPSSDASQTFEGHGSDRASTFVTPLLVREQTILAAR